MQFLNIISTYTFGLGSVLDPFTGSSFNSHLSHFSFSWPGGTSVEYDITPFSENVDIIFLIKSKPPSLVKTGIHLWHQFTPVCTLPLIPNLNPNPSPSSSMYWLTPPIPGPRRSFILHLLWTSCSSNLVAIKLQLAWVVVNELFVFNYLIFWLVTFSNTSPSIPFPCFFSLDPVLFSIPYKILPWGLPPLSCRSPYPFPQYCLTYSVPSTGFKCYLM